jgi:hypothetical protein
MTEEISDELRKARRDYAAWHTADRLTKSPADRHGLAEARARLATLEGVSEVEIAQSRRCNWCGAPSEGLECGAC